MPAGLADPGAQCSDVRNVVLSIGSVKNAGCALSDLAAKAPAGNDDAVASTSVRRLDMMASREFMARRHKPRVAARGGVDDGHAG